MPFASIHARLCCISRSSTGSVRAAHKKIVAAMDAGEKLPFDLDGAAIYYAGPTPAKPGQVIGSVGPTTSGRMDPFAPRLLDAGLSCMIGKGVRNQNVQDAMERNGEPLRRSQQGMTSETAKRFGCLFLCKKNAPEGAQPNG